MPYPAIAAIVRKPGGPFSLEDVELGTLRDNEVLVRIDACGICHTDIKFQELLPLPGVFGHEGTGVIEEVGNDVDDIRSGDRVVLSYPWCGVCPSCDRSEPYRCENIPALKFGGQRTDGSKPISQNGEPLTSAFFQQSSFATRAIALASAVIPIETDQPAEMLAALPCGVQTGAGAILNTFDVQEGEPLIIFGAGAVGLSAVMAGKLVNASPIIVVDVIASRLELALELGATYVFNAREVDVPAKVKELLRHGVRYAFESSATVAALKDAIDCLGQGGKVGIVSAPPAGETFPFSTRGLFERVASLHSIVQGFSIPREFLPKLIAYQEQGLFPYERLVTTYEFKDINQAVADTKSGAVIKPVLRMPTE